jgi:hypothetical protein
MLQTHFAIAMRKQQSVAQSPRRKFNIVNVFFRRLLFAELVAIQVQQHQRAVVQLRYELPHIASVLFRGGQP